MGWWLMVTYQNLDLSNVIIHGISSEQDLAQTHCLGSPISLQVQSLQTSRESKSNISNCCQLLQTVANCKWRPSQNLLRLSTSVVVAICINASILPFFCGIDHDETPPGVLLRFYSRLWHTTLTDAGTNLVQTHSPGLGCSNFRCARGEFNFNLQNKSTTWRLLALRISLFHLHHTACECMLRVFQSFRFCLLSWNDGLMIDGCLTCTISYFKMHFEGIPYLFVQLQRRVDGNKSKAGFEQNHHAWKSSLAQPNSAASSADSNPSSCRKRANLEDAAFRI